jgi:hypothetical protein
VPLCYAPDARERPLVRIATVLLIACIAGPLMITPQVGDALEQAVVAGVVTRGEVFITSKVRAVLLCWCQRVLWLRSR